MLPGHRGPVAGQTGFSIERLNPVERSRSPVGPRRVSGGLVSANLGNSACPKNPRPTASRDGVNCQSFATRLSVDSGVNCVKTDPP